MINVLIIEDEYEAAQRLQRMILKWQPEAKIMAILDSVEQSVKWLKTFYAPDLIFLDIHLSDGLSFEIFDQYEINCPVILTTAYDEYWQKAFEINSIDYLLKPISEERLEKSLNKYLKLKSEGSNQPINLDIIKNLWTQKAKYRVRFLVETGPSIGVLPVENIAYFVAKDKMVDIYTFDGKVYPLKSSLDQLETELEARLFYRANRQFIVSAASIVKLHQHFNYKVKLELKPKTEQDVIVAKTNVSELKEWLSRA